VIERLKAALQGRYRIEREIGAGGMATVYVARDERHDRRVAVKVLRAELAALVGAQRFLAEIRTTAALQHPHILPLFDSGEADGFLFYVMPYVEGDTLRDRLEREKQLPIDEAVRIAAEVADALDYAHRQGIVHRDVKPANVLLQDGRALVADFGIALAVRQAGGDRFTETGLSLGTPHYMSPEQAVGDRSVDARSDVFALGCVLYEMLAGQPPHVGPNAQAVLAKVLTAEPRPVREARRSVPAHVEATVMKALEKLPADRFASAGEFARALRDPTAAPVRTAAYAGASSDASGAGSGARSLPSRRALIVTSGFLLLAVIALGILALALLNGREVPVTSPWVTRVLLDIDIATLAGGHSLSADGRVMAWSTAEGIRVRTFDRLDDRLIPNTAGAGPIALSSDGREVGYIREQELRVVAIDGGASRRLAELGERANLVRWTEAGWIFFDEGLASGVVRFGRVHSRSGVLEHIETADSTLGFSPTDILAGETHALGIAWQFGAPGPSADPLEPRIAALDLNTGAITDLGTGLFPRHEPNTRHLLFVRNGTLMAVPFDAHRIETTGPPFAVMESVGDYDVARDGTLFALLGPLGFNLPVLLDREGRRHDVLAGLSDQYDFQNAYFSPDGGRLVLEMRLSGEDSTNIWVWDLPDGPLARLTWDAGKRPAWTPDGQTILFARHDGIYRVPADATGPGQRVLQGTGIGWIQATPDGGVIFDRTDGSQYDIATASLSGTDSIRLLLDGPWNEEDPMVSPDGRWLAYESDETGSRQVYVMPFGRPGRGRQVSIAGGNNPVWSRSGRELFLRNNQGELEALRVRLDPTFEVVAREILFSPDGFSGRFHPGPGDSVFIARMEAGLRPNTRMVLVRNWIRELEARAAGARR
jgi:eukaryotic-like serine/threonine-protein kinase